MDPSTSLLSAQELRLQLLAGERVGKSLLLASATEDFLAHRDVVTASRADLIESLYQHTRKWVILAHNSAGSRFSYHRLSREQLALILIHRHEVQTSPAAAVPPHWDFDPDLHSGRKPVIGYWLDPALTEPMPRSATDVESGWYTSALLLGALVRTYAFESTIADVTRVCALLRHWAPSYDHTRLANSEQLAARGGAFA